MVVQNNIRKIAITEEQLASLKEAYNKNMVSIKAESAPVVAETIVTDVVEPTVVEPTAEVLESAPVENAVNSFANDSVGSTNIFDTASVSEPSVETPTVDIFSQPVAEETPTFEAPSTEQEVAPIIENPVVEEANSAIENVEVNDNSVSNVPEETIENLDSILNDINKMQEEFAEINTRMIRFGNNIDQLLERIKIYLNNKTLSNVSEGTPTVEEALKSSEVVAPTVEPQINPVESNIQENVATPNFDSPSFDEGVNIFDQPSSFVR